MRIGYPCINRSIGCTPSSTFRLASYSDERVARTVGTNLDCLMRILSYNAAHGILFFRISSDLVPFASHPVCTFPWQKHFADEFSAIGEFIRHHRFRISMHPDQFVLLNAPDKRVLERSVADLVYQAEILELMDLDNSAKLQIHLGGGYQDKTTSMERFIERYEHLDDSIRRRLVLENDERLYALSDCLAVSERTGIPVLPDVFHHSLNNNNECMADLLEPVCASWNTTDGIPMVDYSSQQPGKRPGAHAEHVDPEDFRLFLQSSRPFDVDVMLEIKDKEKSAELALALAHDDSRLFRNRLEARMSA